MRFLFALSLLAAPLAAHANGLDGLMTTPGYEAPSSAAQGPGPTPNQPAPPIPGGPGGSGPPQVPVDGGLTLLALAGAGYAAKKLRARRA